MSFFGAVDILNGLAVSFINNFEAPIRAVDVDLDLTVY